MALVLVFFGGEAADGEGDGLPQRGLLPRANFRGSDPWPLERVFPLSPGCGPLYGDGFEALSLQSLLRSSGEPPVVPGLRGVPKDSGGPGIVAVQTMLLLDGAP